MKWKCERVGGNCVLFLSQRVGITGYVYVEVTQIL